MLDVVCATYARSCRRQRFKCHVSSVALLYWIPAPAIMPRSLASQVRRRAQALSKLGNWIGLFDWVCWAADQKVVLYVLFGANRIDVLDLFYPAVRATLGEEAQRLYVVGVRRGKATIGEDEPLGSWVPAASSAELHPSMYHWVAAAPVAALGATHVRMSDALWDTMEE